MQYLGGKTRLATKIAEILKAQTHRRFVDVFCGALSLTAAMEGERLANDGCAPLIALYKAIQYGWVPPDRISEDDYRATREAMDPNNPLTAFVGFGCSYGGKWWGGYARDKKKNRNFARTAKNLLTQRMDKCMDVTFTCQAFEDVEIRQGDLVYLDPPYQDTTAYGYFDGFDHAKLADMTEQWASNASAIYLSEYRPLPGFEHVASWDIRKSRLKGQQKESLFIWKG